MFILFPVQKISSVIHKTIFLQFVVVLRHSHTVLLRSQPQVLTMLHTSLLYI